MERLTDEQREIIHLQNMESRKAVKTKDLHDWYLCHIKIYELLTARQIQYHYGLINKSINNRNLNL